MARTLQDIAAEQGVTAEELVRKAIETTGTISRAAQKIGVYPNAIYNHLDKHHLRVVRRVVVVPIGEAHDQR